MLINSWWISSLLVMLQSEKQIQMLISTQDDSFFEPLIALIKHEMILSTHLRDGNIPNMSFEPPVIINKIDSRLRNKL